MNNIAKLVEAATDEQLGGWYKSLVMGHWPKDFPDCPLPESAEGKIARVLNTPDMLQIADELQEIGKTWDSASEMVSVRLGTDKCKEIAKAVMELQGNDADLAMPIMVNEKGAAVLPGGVEIAPPQPQYLRPQVGSFWDTEIIPDAEAIDAEGLALTELQMFTRPIDKEFRWKRTLKTADETNMVLCASIPKPTQFMVCGFSLKLDDEGLPEDERKAIRSGRFQFRAAGDRVQFEERIADIAETRDAKKDWEMLVSQMRKNHPDCGLAMRNAAEYFAKMDNPPLRSMLEGS